MYQVHEQYGVSKVRILYFYAYVLYVIWTIIIQLVALDMYVLRTSTLAEVTCKVQYVIPSFFHSRVN